MTHLIPVQDRREELSSGLCYHMPDQSLEHFNIWHNSELYICPVRQFPLLSEHYGPVLNLDAFHLAPEKHLGPIRQSLACHSQRSKDNRLTYLIRVQDRREEIMGRLFFNQFSELQHIPYRILVKFELRTISATHGINVCVN